LEREQNYAIIQLQEVTMRRFFTFVTGAVCGALVGATAALLLTPASGEELQKRISDQSNTFKDEIRGAYEARMAQLESELASLRKPKITLE
jgi:gas vesicle protein